MEMVLKCTSIYINAPISINTNSWNGVREKENRFRYRFTD